MKMLIDMPDKAYEMLLTEQKLPKDLDVEYLVVHGMPINKTVTKYYDVTVINKQNKRNYTYVYVTDIEYDSRLNTIKILFMDGHAITYSLKLWWVHAEPKFIAQY